MKIINLVKKEHSDISYEIIEFPDGEAHIVLNPFDRKESYQVITRISSMDDLFILLQVGDILDRAAVEWDLLISYLFTMRMDRVISFNEAFSLKIIANLINTMNFASCYVIEAHSDRVAKLIKNCQDCYFRDIFSDKWITVFPDEGASLRYEDPYLSHSYTRILECAKVTDAAGNLQNFVLKDEKSLEEDPYIPLVVYDDLCDTGETSIQIYNLLKAKYPLRRIEINVVHAVNPVGIERLCSTYDSVTITNSYKDWSNYAEKFSNLQILEVI